MPQYPADAVRLYSKYCARSGEVSRNADHKQAAAIISRYTVVRIISGESVMKVNDRVTVKTDGGPCRMGKVLAIERINEGTMYLVALNDYPRGIWFFNESEHAEGVFMEPYEEPDA